MMSTPGYLARLDDQLNCCADLAVNFYVYEFRDADDMNAIVLEITGSQHKGFNRLIDRSGSDGLYFGSLMLTNHTCNCPGDRRGTGVCRNFDYFHNDLPIRGKRGRELSW